MAEIKLFNEWLETHDISTSAITLWYALMYIAWCSGWPEWLCIPVPMLKTGTKMSRSTLYREREALRDNGLIDFDAVIGRQSCKYKIIGFEARNKSIETSHTGTFSGTSGEEMSHTGTFNGTSGEEMSHTRTFNGTSGEEMSHTGTFSGASGEKTSHTGTFSGTSGEKTSHTGTFSGASGEETSHTGTFNPARVPSEADLTVEKNEKSPIYINKYKDINKGGCGGKKKNDDEVKSKSPKKKKPEFDLSFIGDEAWETLVGSWLEYKRSRNESYKSDMSVKKFHTMLRNLSRGDPAAARRIIDKSIANNWAGIFELTDTAAKSRGQPAMGQRIGQIKQPEDEERRRKLLEKFGGSGNDRKNKT